MSKFYIVKKDGKEIRCESASAAFEAWDCFGRHDTIVEMHIIDTDFAGNKYEYIDSYGKMARRKSKYGQTYFYFRDQLSSEKKLLREPIDIDSLSVTLEVEISELDADIEEIEKAVKKKFGNRWKFDRTEARYDSCIMAIFERY